MNTTLSEVRQAIQSEIKRLHTELAKMEKIIAQLDEGAETAPRGRGRPVGSGAGKRKYTRRQKASEDDVTNAVKLIEKAGKGGIKAIKLAHEIKKSGGAKPSKIDLLATEKVKMTGTGGGSTYVYVG